MAMRTWIVRVRFPNGMKSDRIDAPDEASARAQVEERLNTAGLPPVGIAEVVPA